MLFFNWDYFDEARAFGNGNVGWYVVARGRPQRGAARSRRRSMRCRSTPITRPRPRPSRRFNAAFVSQFGDIGLIVGAIMGAVFFTLMLLTGNTMAQAVRERIPELAVLKTIGFSNRSVLALVLAESVLLIAAGRCDRAAAGRRGGGARCAGDRRARLPMLPVGARHLAARAGD